MNQRGFVIPSFLFDPRVWAAMAIAGAAFGAWWYVHSLRSQVETLQAWKDAAILESAKNEQQVMLLNAANDLHSQEVANGYAQAIRSITTDYDSRIGRMLHAGGNPRAVAAVPGSASRIDGAAADDRPDTAGDAAGAEDAGVPPLAETCLKLEQDAVATTLQTLYLQHWIKGIK